MDVAGRAKKSSNVSISVTDSSRSTSTSSLGEVVGFGYQLRHIPSEGLMAMIRREESVSAEGVGFQSNYEPKEILGRYERLRGRFVYPFLSRLGPHTVSAGDREHMLTPLVFLISCVGLGNSRAVLCKARQTAPCVLGCACGGNNAL